MYLKGKKINDTHKNLERLQTAKFLSFIAMLKRELWEAHPDMRGLGPVKTYRVLVVMPISETGSYACMYELQEILPHTIYWTVIKLYLNYQKLQLLCTKKKCNSFYTIKYVHMRRNIFTSYIMCNFLKASS